MTDDDKDGSQAALPDPRLQSLDKLVGTWNLKHRDLNTGKEWLGRDTFEWMDGGFFLAFHHEEFGKNIKGLMIIGYEKKWGEEKPSEEVIGHWFESSTGSHYTYIWEVDDKTVTFWLENKDSGMAFKGTFSDDHKTVSGTWKWLVVAVNSSRLFRLSESNIFPDAMKLPRVTFPVMQFAS